jgi:F0F1-type ATP synthase epsilon subunit
MKNVLISVSGGVAEVKENEHNLRICIVDFDNENEEEELTAEEMKFHEVVVYVSGGVAELVYQAEWINAEIVDYDNEED